MAFPFLEYAHRRLSAFLEEIAHVAESEFPYRDSIEALQQLKRLYEQKLSRLQSFDEKSDRGIVEQRCTLELKDLFNYLPRLGFILRSTNVRNAFELFGPIKRLAAEVLEPTIPRKDRKTGLLLSSEWDYSLLIFREDPVLPDFVLIGLPAHESANPLLVPLVGHELGHSVWSKHQYGIFFAPQVADKVVTIISEPSHWAQYQKVFAKPGVQPTDLESNDDLRKTWEPSLRWALKQAEETFCDLLGVILFGTSFLHAFAYLLSPGGLGRPPVYPELSVRIQNQATAAKTLGIPVPADYESQFRRDSLPSLAPADQFRLTIADKAVQQMLDQLLGKAKEVVEKTTLKSPSQEKIESIEKHIRKLVPAEDCNSLAEILNAAWRVYDNYPPDWEQYPRVKKDKGKVLKEIVLKTIEVFEIQMIQQEEE